MSKPELTAIVLDPNQASCELPAMPASARVVRSAAEALAQASEPRGFVLDVKPGMVVSESVLLIRRHRSWGLKPIFLRVPAEPWTMALCDGVVPDWTTAELRATEIDDLLSTLPLAGAAPDGEERLLRFLYARPQATLQPIRDPASRRLYRYPLLEVFADAGEDVFGWLHSLLNRGLLTRERLVDRIRACPRCGHSHLNYVDCCPNCKSIDIIRKIFLHCFACGFVAPQEEFHRKGLLECPKCLATLRHIGVDYDRALENHQCQSCRHIFSEAEVVARCLDCENVARPDELEVHGIYELVLSERGRLAVRNGSLRDVFAILDHLNYATPQHFSQVVDWWVQLGKRHRETTFSLLRLSLENVDELVAAVGRSRTALLIEAFAERLRQLVRTTDLPTRVAENVFLLFLPNTGSAAAEVLRKRILALQKDTEIAKGAGLRLRISRYTYPDDYLTGETAALIFSRLAAMVEAGT